MITSQQQQPTGAGAPIAGGQKQASKVLALFLLVVLFVLGMFFINWCRRQWNIPKAALERNISSLSQLSIMIATLEGDANTAWSSTVGLQPQLKHRQNPTPTHSLINDKTLHWDVHVEWPWLQQDLKNKNKPQVQILLTNVGWNHPNQTCAVKNHPQSLHERSLMEGVVNHPLFHPAGWDYVESGRTPVQDNICCYGFFINFNVWIVIGPNAVEANMDNHDNCTTNGGQSELLVHDHMSRSWTTLPDVTSLSIHKEQQQ